MRLASAFLFGVAPAFLCLQSFSEKKGVDPLARFKRHEDNAPVPRPAASAPDPLARFRAHYNLPSTAAGGLSAAFDTSASTSTTAEYKQQGDADPVWSGEGGEPDGPPIELYIREPTLARPNPIPPLNWVTEKQKEYLESIFRTGHMSEQEVELMREYMSTFEFTDIKRDGVYGQDGLPGYPAHIRPVADVRGHAWLAKNIRILDELPPDLWSVPRARFAAREDRDQLTPAESARLPKHRIYSSKPTPRHPKKYPGARAMTAAEEKEWASIGVEKDAVLEIETKCAEAVSEGLNEDKFAKMPGVTVALLKKYCQAKGLPTSGNKPALVTRVWEYVVVESQAEDSNDLDRLDEQNAIAGNSDFEIPENEEN